MLGLLTGHEGGKSESDRVPPPVQVKLPDGTVRTVQINFCKNPDCANFGIPAAGKKHARRAKQPEGPPAGYDYALSGGRGSTPFLKCQLCGEFPPIKSNLGVGEELMRLARYLDMPRPASCRTAGCANTEVPVSNPAAYQLFGKSERGSQRFRCRACGKTLSVAASPVLRQRLPHKNRTIFKLLMNKAPLSRICEVAEVSMQTVYDKLDFFHQQCLVFAAKHERVLLNGFRRDRLYVAVDRQSYVVNWTERKDKRNVVLNALGSADLDTGYVFGMHLNFDSEVSATEVSAQAAALGDYVASPPFRRHARLWLEPDYIRATDATARRLSRKASGDLSADIEAGYRDAETREDIESQELITAGVKFPKSGMQVRSEYTLYGHFFLLRELFRGVDKVRFYLDQESGIRAACLAAFEHEVRARTCDAFYVRLEKELSDGEKKRLIAESRRAFLDAQHDNPGLSPSQVKVLLMREELARAAVHGRWKDRWLLHPFPNNSEPKKALCYLTDLGDYDEDHLANLYLKGSLHSIDRFFMQVRRRLSFLERPIATASKTFRTWYGYSAYRPENIEKLLAILRVYYNYCLAGEDDKTPAMRLGLSTHVVQFDELMGVK
jgi:transposase-like protein